MGTKHHDVLGGTGGQYSSYKKEIKNASTSSVDKSVYERWFTHFSGYKTAREQRIAYFVGIEFRHPVTTIYSVEGFSSM